MTATLELIIPGLLGPVPPLQRLPLTPTLDLLLALGRFAQDDAEVDLASALLQRFGADASAPYALAADDPSWDKRGWWLHADPVHLRPDRDLLRLFDARHLGISRAEADALTAALNAHFRDDGLQVYAPVADRWYLRCAAPPVLTTTPLARVNGQHIDGYLPVGADAGTWASRMTEAQMLLFQQAANHNREAAGRPAVNGLWCWGGGRWAPPALAPAVAVGSAPLLRGLAQAAGIGAESSAELPALLAAADGRVLVVHEALDEALQDQDPTGWAGAAEQLDAWLAPLPAALRDGRVQEVRLYPCDGCCLVVRRADLSVLRRLLKRPPWQRPDTLAASARAPSR
jgi:hypothetical protein